MAPASCALQLERRASPPHLSTMLGQLPFLQPQPARAGAPGPALQRRPSASCAAAAERASMEQLRQELMAEGADSGAGAQLDRLLSTQLPAPGPSSQAGGGPAAAAAAPTELVDWEVSPHGALAALQRGAGWAAQPACVALGRR